VVQAIERALGQGQRAATDNAALIRAVGPKVEDGRYFVLWSTGGVSHEEQLLKVVLVSDPQTLRPSGTPSTRISPRKPHLLYESELMPAFRGQLGASKLLNPTDFRRAIHNYAPQTRKKTFLCRRRIQRFPSPGRSSKREHFESPGGCSIGRTTLVYNPFLSPVPVGQPIGGNPGGGYLCGAGRARA